MAKLSKDTKERIIISLTSDSAGKELIKAVEEGDDGITTASAPLNYDSVTQIISIEQADADSNGYLSFTDWQTFNSKASSSDLTTLENKFKAAQTIFVDKSNTNTYTADGSLTKPFKSLKDMYDNITDASNSKKYCCVIAPGAYSELATIRIKPYIDLTCLANDTVSITIAGGATFKWSNNQPGRTFFSNIAILSGIEVLNDNPSGTSGCVLDLDNVQAASLVFNGRGGGKDYIQLRNDTLIQGVCTINSAATTIFDSTIIGNLTMTDVGCVFPDGYGSAITATLRSNYELNLTITNTTYDVYVDAWGNNPLSSLSITSNSSYPSTFNTDSSSYPNSITLTGSPAPVLQRTSISQSIGYTPANPANWAGTAPKTTKEALDRMAALLKTLNSNLPIP